MTTRTATNNRGSCKRLVAPTLYYLVALSAGACNKAIAEEAQSVPLDSTDELQASLEARAKELKRSVDDLAATVTAKDRLYDECLSQYHADPSRGNWARIYVVHFALKLDEAVILSRIAGLGTQIAFTVQRDLQTKRAFLEVKTRALRDQENKLNALRERYNQLNDTAQRVTSAAERERYEKQREGLLQLITEEWRTKAELDKTVARTNAAAQRGEEDIRLLAGLGGAIKQRRDLALARLARDYEKYQRGRTLGPDEESQAAKEGLGTLLGTVANLAKRLEDRAPPEAESETGGETESYRKQIQAFLAANGPAESPDAVGPEKPGEQTPSSVE